MEYFRPDVKVGVFLFVSLALLVAAAIVVGDIGSRFVAKHHYTVLLSNANLLHRRAQVSYAGSPVGEVVDIVARPETERTQRHTAYPIAVTIAVQTSVPLHKNARVEMKTDGFIGDRYLDISPGAGELLPDGATIVGSIGGLEGILASLSGIGSGLGEVGNALRVLLADTSEPHSLPSLMSKVQQLVDTLMPGLTTLSTGIDDLLQGVEQEVARTGDKADRTLERINATIAENRGGLQQVIHELNTSLAKANQTLTTMQQFLETSQTDVSGLVKSLRTVSSSLQHQTETMTTQLQQLLARMDTMVAQNDRNIYMTIENLRDMTANLKATSQLLRANPAVLLWGNRGVNNGNNPIGPVQNTNQVLQDRGRIGRYDRAP